MQVKYIKIESDRLAGEHGVEAYSKVQEAVRSAARKVDQRKHRFLQEVAREIARRDG